MKTVWKWIIGIVIGLVVVGLLVGAAFLVRNYLPLHRAVIVGGPGWHMRGDGFPGYMMRGFGMHGYGMMGYGRILSFGGIFGGLLGLGFLALVVLGIIWLVRSLRKPQSATVEMHTCANCGKPVQADWRNCPYCGKKQ